MNVWNGIGTLGSEPNLKYTQQGKAVAEVSIAVKDPYIKDKSKDTDWINIIFWDKKAEVIGKYLRKGDKIGITGKMKTQIWEKDGEKRYKTYILAEQLYFVNNKGKQENSTGYEEDTEEYSGGAVIDNSDPFPF